MLKPERVAAFCDGVIAIAITLLVLGLEVPSVHEVPQKELGNFLFDSLPSIQGYLTSFLLIGTYWTQHFLIFQVVARADRRFVILNGLFLLSVSFVPFPTGLQVAYRQDELAMILYAASQAGCGFSLLAIWRHATQKNRLIDDRVTIDMVQSMSRVLWITPILSLAAMAISFVSLDLSRLIFLGVPLSLLSHRIVDRERRTDVGR